MESKHYGSHSFLCVKYLYRSLSDCWRRSNPNNLCWLTKNTVNEWNQKSYWTVLWQFCLTQRCHDRCGLYTGTFPRKPQPFPRWCRWPEFLSRASSGLWSPSPHQSGSHFLSMKSWDQQKSNHHCISLAIRKGCLSWCIAICSCRQIWIMLIIIMIPPQDVWWILTHSIQRLVAKQNCV